MNKEELINFCLIDKDSLLSFPFSDKKYGLIPVIRHKSNKKWYALIFIQENTLYINLKCNPIDAEILRDNHPYITPAWHMNKSHWNKVDVNKAPKKMLKNLILESFNLTK
ncbi:TPA: MmcQ/YjbR family DNA-binding protein [Candidatus Galligastranaerophilus intestinigallinarum]|mgnify:FL=1|nr:MmcQ/YjbR family DNA-binding protein [Candidatus Galligastranaerophilus intestinigallinarum]